MSERVMEHEGRSANELEAITRRRAASIVQND